MAFNPQQLYQYIQGLKPEQLQQLLQMMSQQQGDTNPMIQRQSESNGFMNAFAPIAMQYFQNSMMQPQTPYQDYGSAMSREPQKNDWWSKAGRGVGYVGQGIKGGLSGALAGGMASGGNPYAAGVGGVAGFSAPLLEAFGGQF